MSPFLAAHYIMRQHWSRLLLAVMCTIVLLTSATALHAQTVPFIGSIIWTHNGYDKEAQRFRNIEAVDQAAHGGIIVVGTNTATNNVPFERKRVGELLILREATGELVRADTVCPQFSTPGDLLTLSTVTINDSATVVCYTCHADGIHLASWPDMVPIVDTMLRGFNRGWLSNTGRYMILERELPTKDLNLFAYDRLTGDTVFINAITENTYTGPDFSADDKYVVLERNDGGSTLLYVLDLENMRTPPKIFRVGEYGSMRLSYRGNRLLYSADGAVGVIDVETGNRIWGISEDEYPVWNMFISANGNEVFLLRNGGFLQPPVVGSLSLFRYRLSSADPDGILDQSEIDSGSSWNGSPVYPQPKIQGQFATVLQRTTLAGYFSHDTRTALNEESDSFTPILYPNPATSSVTMRVGACADASWVVTIHDQSGREVWQRTISCQDSALRFDVAGLRTGSYAVRATVPMSKQTATAMLVVR